MHPVNTPRIVFISSLAGANLLLRGVGLVVLPKLGIPVTLAARVIWPFEQIGDDITGVIWTMIGLFLIVIACLSNRTPKKTRALARWLGLWMYWDLVIYATINMLTSTDRPWVWGSWVANAMIAIWYSWACWHFNIEAQRRISTWHHLNDE
jgi:hypothetical protein